jgi:hypothetical protein
MTNLDSLSHRPNLVKMAQLLGERSNTSWVLFCFFGLAVVSCGRTHESVENTSSGQRLNAE